MKYFPVPAWDIQNIYLEPGSIVEGDVVSIGGTINQSGDAHIGGQQVSLGSLGLSGIHLGSFSGNWLNFGLSLWRLVAVLFLGWVVFWLFPRQVNASGDAIDANPLRAVVFGLLGYLALIPATILLIVTLLGIPLVPILWLGVAAARLVGQVALGLLAGRWLAPRLNLQLTNVFQVLLGLLALGLITALPVVGSLASLFYGLVGFGAVVWTRFGTKPVILAKE